MAVQVAACVNVSEADGLSALDGGSSVAQGIARPSNTPVAVTVFNRSYPGHRLLPTACFTCTTHTGKTVQRCLLCIYWKNTYRSVSQHRING